MLQRRRTWSALLVVALGIGLVDARLLLDAEPSRSATPGARIDGAPARVSADGHLRGPAAVAPGGRLRLVVRGVPLPARVQELVGRRWVTRGGPIRSDGGSARFRVRGAEGRIALRALDADGVGSKALRVAVRALRMTAVGDINLSPAPLGAVSGGDVAAPWASVGPRLRGADLTFGNLETAVSTRGTPQEKQFRFRSSPASVAAMARLSGMDVVNLANNHTGDYGRLATLDTLRHVRAAGMTPVGAGKDAAEAYRPRIVERLGLRIAFVGFSNILPAEFRAGVSTPGTAWATPEAVRSAVRSAARQADVVVATFHWGTELQTTPADGQATLAREAIRAGATAVIGAHPHVLQPTIGVGPDRVIAYSLGNFVFPARSAGTTRTGILELRLAAGRVLSRSFVSATIHGATPVLAGG